MSDPPPCSKENQNAYFFLPPPRSSPSRPAAPGQADNAQSSSLPDCGPLSRKLFFEAPPAMDACRPPLQSSLTAPVFRLFFFFFFFFCFSFFASLHKWTLAELSGVSSPDPRRKKPKEKPRSWTNWPPLCGVFFLSAPCEACTTGSHALLPKPTIAAVNGPPPSGRAGAGPGSPVWRPGEFRSVAPEAEVFWLTHPEV